MTIIVITVISIFIIIMVTIIIIINHGSKSLAPHSRLFNPDFHPQHSPEHVTHCGGVVRQDLAEAETLTDLDMKP